MKQAGCARWQFLKLGTSVPIKPGDVCSLLPDKCWFKVISMPDMMEENNQILKRKADENLSNEADSKKACLSSNVEVTVSPSETSNDTVNDKDSSNEHQNSSINGNSEHNDETAPVLQEIYSASSLGESSMPATCSKESADSQNIIESCVEQQNDKKQKAKNINLANEAMTNIEAEKKIKWDCDPHFSDQTETRASPAQSNPRSPVAVHQDPASVPNSTRTRREKCMYGARCYRKNPNHRNNYSHPADSDYDEIDDRQECPYGRKCYRKNPQHKMQFKHTNVPRQRRRAATPMHSVTVDTTSEDYSSAEESVDESDYEPSMYTDSSDDLDESRSEWEDGTTG